MPYMDASVATAAKPKVIYSDQRKLSWGVSYQLSVISWHSTVQFMINVI